MKMYLGNVPVKGAKIGTNTDDATFIASDLQAGKTGYSGGRKITGTGKCFSFATYGSIYTNIAWPIPSDINVIEIACMNYPIQLTLALNEMKNIDFSNAQTVANIIIDGVAEQITVVVQNNMMTIECAQKIQLQAFYGKDEYV